MHLVTTCPFSSLAAVFFAVPLGVIVGIYGTELSASFRRHQWRAKRH